MFPTLSEGREQQLWMHPKVHTQHLSDCWGGEEQRGEPSQGLHARPGIHLTAKAFLF